MFLFGHAQLFCFSSPFACHPFSPGTRGGNLGCSTGSISAYALLAGCGAILHRHAQFLSSPCACLPFSLEKMEGNLGYSTRSVSVYALLAGRFSIAFPSLPSIRLPSILTGNRGRKSRVIYGTSTCVCTRHLLAMPGFTRHLGPLGISVPLLLAIPGFTRHRLLALHFHRE